MARNNNMDTLSLRLNTKMNNIIDIFIEKLKSIVLQAKKHNKNLTCATQSKPKLICGVSFIQFLHNNKKSKKKNKLEDGVLWRRSILMGEKCDPLAFSGVIHYDCNGKVSDPPMASPLRGSLPAFLMLVNQKSAYPDKINER